MPDNDRAFEPPARTEPPSSGPPKEMASGFLDLLRETLLWKTGGLTREQLAAPATPSTMSLLGMLKHIALVERYWFQQVLAGRDVTYPWTKEDPDAEWRIEPGDTYESVCGLYGGEIEQSRRIVREMAWDDLAKEPRGRENGTTLAWVMMHMIEETARHCGHADLMRERIDGLVGE